MIGVAIAMTGIDNKRISGVRQANEYVGAVGAANGATPGQLSGVSATNASICQSQRTKPSAADVRSNFHQEIGRANCCRTVGQRLSTRGHSKRPRMTKPTSALNCFATWGVRPLAVSQRLIMLRATRAATRNSMITETETPAVAG